MARSSRFIGGVLTAALVAVACAGAPREARRPAPELVPAPVAQTPGKLTTDPDLNRPAPARLLAIDWSKVVLASDADALALWAQIAPTGEDWEAKLDEIPDEGPIASRLALALLRAGNLTCAPAPAPPAAAASPSPPTRPGATLTTTCTRPVDIDTPLPTATLDDPCLRRVLALWSIASLDDADLAAARDALRAIARIPPPESQLVSAALDALPEDDHAGRLELRALAWQAGHTELVNGKLSSLDVPHLIEAVQKHHIAGALEILSAEAHRPVYLAAVVDPALPASARTMAMVELTTLDGPVARDVRTVLVTATRDRDCTVAAHAARTLVRLGEGSFGPARPRTRKPEVLLRALCVVASYEAGLRADEPSFLPGYVPRRGLEIVRVAFDPHGVTDDDGDGSPQTERTAAVVPHDEVTLPEVEDLVRAFRRCTGTTCASDEREFRFGFKPGPGGDLLLHRLEVVERPPCVVSPP